MRQRLGQEVIHRCTSVINSGTRANKLQPTQQEPQAWTQPPLVHVQAILAPLCASSEHVRSLQICGTLNLTCTQLES